MYESYGKRIMDIAIASGCLVLLSPLMLVIAILIVVFDGSPVIFHHTRVGRFGSEFRCYKFRTMPPSTPNVSSDRISEVRLTWIGKFLRRTNLDELPQLLNILRGDMSIVGPRPPIPDQLDLLRVRSHNGSLVCRPGLTGLAQVNSFSGMSAEEKAAFDHRYAQNVSFAGDLKIMAATLRYLSKPPPVY